ncbi:hypothetical protein AVDCRST_MAG92-3798, partial [uncultured Coleofasciculus sp.]
ATNCWNIRRTSQAQGEYLPQANRQKSISSICFLDNPCYPRAEFLLFI